MAAEQYLQKETPSAIQWQINSFFQSECGYSPIDRNKNHKKPEYLELERRLNQTTFPRYHLYINFPQPYQIKTDLYFEASSHSERRTRQALEQKDQEAKRILAKLEDHQGLDIYRFLKSALNYSLLFQTSNNIYDIKEITDHDLKQELIASLKSRARLRNIQKSIFLRKKQTQIFVEDFSSD